MSNNIFFTADTHWGHCKIIEYCNRPYKNGDEQDEKMLENFNSVLRPGDRLYHLGDVAHSTCNIKSILDRLACNEVHLIFGNHDKHKLLIHPKIKSYQDLKSISIDKQRIVLCHYAMRSWVSKMRGTYHLYGHSHGKLPGFGRSMDVGVDTNNYYPYSWDEIKAKLEPIDPGAE